MTIKQDPALYRKLSEPHENPTVANERITEFYADVRAAREKHHIRDVLVVISGATMYEDGVEGEYHAYAEFGDQRNGPALAAYALGEAQSDVRERINKLAAGKRRGRDE